MSGHSKWATIKHKKGKTDAKRGKLFSKLSRAITVAAREGGADPAMNISLANAIEKAKAESMPKDNIERAIQRGAGGAERRAVREHPLRGLRPRRRGDHRRGAHRQQNRSAAEVRNIFTKHGGQLAQPGAVAWVFERRGSIVVDGAQVRARTTSWPRPSTPAPRTWSQDGDEFQVLTQPADFAAVRDALDGGRHRVRATPSSP